MQSNDFNFKGENIFVGIDVHKDSWEVAVLTELGMKKIFHMNHPCAKDLRQTLDKLFPQGNFLSVYESGFSGFSTHFDLLSQGIQNMVINAADVPSSQKESVSKTDKVDALKLAKALRSGLVFPIHIPNPETIALRELVRLRSKITIDIMRYKNRIKHFLLRQGVIIPPEQQTGAKTWSRQFVHWVQSQTKLLCVDHISLDLYIQTYQALLSQKKVIMCDLRQMASKERWSRQINLLCSICGIGFKTAVLLVSEIEDVKRFGNEKLFASFIGLIPTCHNSGEKVYTGEITFRAHRQLRRQLIESAWVAIRHDQALGACYLQYIKRMDKNKAIIRIAHKLTNRIYTVLKREIAYETGIN